MPAFALTACKQEIECEHWYEEVNIRATCTTEGHRQARCAVCGAISWDEEVPIIPTAHVVTLWEVTRQVTTCTDGEEEGTCDNCASDVHRVIDARHNYGESTTTFPATCLLPGTATTVCKSCGERKTLYTKALGHRWRKADNGWSVCTRCLTSSPRPY